MLADTIASSTKVGLPGAPLARYFARPDALSIENFLHLDDPSRETART